MRGNINWYVSASTPGVLTNIYRDRDSDTLVLFVNNRDDVVKGVEIAFQSEALSLNDKNEYEMEEITGSAKYKISGEKVRLLQLTVNGNSVSVWRIKYGNNSKKIRSS